MTIPILITLLSLAVALGMSALAWRAMREERRRSDARVAVLASELTDDSALVDESRSHVADEPEPAHEWETAPAFASSHDDTMFGLSRDGGTPSRMPIAVATGGLIIGTIIAFAMVLSSGGTPAASSAASAASASAPAASSERPAATTGHAIATTDSRREAARAPLELVTLTYERGAGNLMIRGIVRNPANGAAADHVTAVVLLFDREGRDVATGRAAVDSTSLAPGAESAFAVSLPASPGVSRYRVSFRTDDHVISHVDKRDGA